MSLAGKKIVLGVSGGIAAYKTPELVRRLRDRGADVRVAMTEAAKAFITPLSLQAVSGYPVSDSLLDPAAEAAMGHIELGKWADLVILAPATADLIARVAAGMANDLVSTICLATPAPVAVLPAMNQQMYRAAATQHNLEVLASRGLLIWGPDSGSQACGDIGPGRMLDPLTIVDMAVAHFSPVNDLKHLNIMITAGPTREPLDPVRYISNHSSGKMGFAIAAAAARRGANVTLVSGPVSLPTPPFVKRVDVMTALEMDVPLVILKKSKSSILKDGVLQTEVFSFTKNAAYQLTLKREFVREGDRVLLIDDFMANGEAALGGVKLLEAAGATVSGIGIVIAKCFQPGLGKLRGMGYRVEALAPVSRMGEGFIEFES